MNRKTKRWAIIIIDLAIVFGFYFAYIHFYPTMEETDEGAREFETRITHQQVQYSLHGNLKEERVNMTFRLKNQNGNSRSIQLPNGIVLMLTDGQENVYRNRIMESTSFDLSGGETRSWQRTFNAPKEIQENLMAGFFIDDNRQKLVQVSR